MKIEWLPNPLKSKVVLDDSDRRTLRLCLRVEELTDRIVRANFILDAEARAARMNHVVVKSADERVNNARTALDISYVLDDEARDGKMFDEWLVERVEYYERELLDEHVGDCTCVPSSCSKCYAENLIEIDTLKGLGKHAAHYIQSAFYPPAPGSPERSIDEAIAYLRDYEPLKLGAYEKFSDEDFHSYVPAWKEDARKAHDWLINYKVTKLHEL